MQLGRQKNRLSPAKILVLGQIHYLVKESIAQCCHEKNNSAEKKVSTVAVKTLYSYENRIFCCQLIVGLKRKKDTNAVKQCINGVVPLKSL